MSEHDGGSLFCVLALQPDEVTIAECKQLGMDASQVKHPSALIL